MLQALVARTEGRVMSQGAAKARTSSITPTAASVQTGSDEEAFLAICHGILVHTAHLQCLYCRYVHVLGHWIFRAG